MSCCCQLQQRRRGRAGEDHRAVHSVPLAQRARAPAHAAPLIGGAEQWCFIQRRWCSWIGSYISAVRGGADLGLAAVVTASRPQPAAAGAHRLRDVSPAPCVGVARPAVGRGFDVVAHTCSRGHLLVRLTASRQERQRQRQRRAAATVSVAAQEQGARAQPPRQRASPSQPPEPPQPSKPPQPFRRARHQRWPPPPQQEPQW